MFNRKYVLVLHDMYNDLVSHDGGFQQIQCLLTVLQVPPIPYGDVGSVR